MATTEEKQELVETLKGPRYYRLSLSGYGGESAYMSISKEAYDFWKPVCEEHGDSDLTEYMLCEELDECDFEEIQDLPVEAQFLHDVGDDNYKQPWYESHTEFEHTHGVEYTSARITVTEVDSIEYGANIVGDEDVVDRESLQEYLSTLEEEYNYEIELVEMGCCDEAVEHKYIAQMYSSENGTFFEGIIETVGNFDPKKLKFHTTEFLNGEDTVTEIYYDGVEVDNYGVDINGKGYSASVWTNV